MWTDDWRRNLMALTFGQMLSLAGFSFFMPLLPLYVQHLGAFGTTQAAQWAGAMNVTSSLAMAAVQPFWGTMADRWGRKPMVIRSMVGAGCTTILLGLAASPEQLLALYTIQGLVTGTMAASTALVAASMPTERLGFGLGMLQVSVFLGASLGPLGGGVVADAYGYRTTFFGAGTLLILSAGVVNALVRESFERPQKSARGKSTWAESRSLLGIGLFPLLLAVIFMIQFANSTMAPVLSLFIAELQGRENAATAVGIVMAAVGAAGALSAFVVGRLGDRLGHSPVLLVSLAGAALCYFPQSIVQEVWQLLLLRTLMGAFLGGTMPAANALVAAVIPRERRGAAFGLTSSANALSHAVGPAYGAGVATLWGLRAVFLATGAVCGLTFLWAAASFRKRGVPARAVEPTISGDSPLVPPEDASPRLG